MAPHISTNSPSLASYLVDDNSPPLFCTFPNPNQGHTVTIEMGTDDLAETPPSRRLPQSNHIPSSSEKYSKSDATNENTPRVSRDQLGSAQAINGSKTSPNPAMNEVYSSSGMDDEAPRHVQAEQYTKPVTRPRQDSTEADITMLDVQDQCTMAVKSVQDDFAAIGHPSGAGAAEIQMEMFRQTTQVQLDLLKTSIEKGFMILSSQIQSVAREQPRMLNEVDDLRKDVEEVKTALKDKVNDLEVDKLVMINSLDDVARDWMDENILNRQPNSVTIISRRGRD